MRAKKRLLLLMTIIACVMATSPVFAKSMQVICKIKYESPYSHWTYRFTYRKDNGLMKRCIMNDTPQYYVSYFYNKDGSMKALRDYGDEGLEGTQTFKYAANGKLAAVDIDRIENGKSIYTNALKYKWGNTSCKVTMTELAPETYKFDATGRLVQDTLAITDGTVKYRYYYDENGYVRSRKIIANAGDQKSTYTTKYENKYKNNLLSKVRYTDEEGFNNISFIYKTIEVPSAYVSKVQAQQDYVLHYCVIDYSPNYFTTPAMW